MPSAKPAWPAKLPASSCREGSALKFVSYAAWKVNVLRVPAKVPAKTGPRATAAAMLPPLMPRPRR